MLKIRRPLGRLIFNMGIAIPGKTVFLIETAPSFPWYAAPDLLTAWMLNSSPPGQNGRHFADNMFKCIFLNENIWISNKISLKNVPWGLIDRYVSTGSDNGLVSFRRQGIIWTNADAVYWCIYAEVGGEELKITTGVMMKITLNVSKYFYRIITVCDRLLMSNMIFSTQHL